MPVFKSPFAPVHKCVRIRHAHGANALVCLGTLSVQKARKHEFFLASS